MKSYFFRKLALHLFPVLALGFSGCNPPRNEAPLPGTHPSAESKASVAAAPVDYVASAVQAGQNAKGTLELITIRKAIESFQQEEGHNPSSLEELVQKSYLKLMPPAPAGLKLEYDPQTGNVKFAPNAQH